LKIQIGVLVTFCSEVMEMVFLFLRAMGCVFLSKIAIEIHLRSRGERSIMSFCNESNGSDLAKVHDVLRLNTKSKKDFQTKTIVLTMQIKCDVNVKM